MERIKRYLTVNHHLSNYQVAQIFFLCKTLFSEISKILLMGVLFAHRLPFYFFALFIMVFLRCSMGGLHFDTYIGCLAASTLYLWLAVVLLPRMAVARALQIIALLLCILICNVVGPVVSKYRPASIQKQFRKNTRFTTLFILIYGLILYRIPQNPYMRVGFWVILLHSLQLMAAKIRKKGEPQNDR